MSDVAIVIKVYKVPLYTVHVHDLSAHAFLQQVMLLVTVSGCIAGARRLPTSTSWSRPICITN